MVCLRYSLVKFTMALSVWLTVGSTCSYATASDTDNHNELTLYKAIEQKLLNDTNGELFRLRGAFFPAMKYKFWMADSLQAIQFDACLTINDTLCPNVSNKHSAFGNKSSITRCQMYQWTNSYVLGLVATHQLYQFEPVLTSLIYGQTVGHREVKFDFKLNLSDPILCTIKESDLEKYFMSFISWTKAYATAQGKPKTWSTDDQGYVSRKYDMYTKGIRDNTLQDSINNTILACFISSNCFLLYMMLLCGRRLYHNIATSLDTTIKQNACRGMLIVVAFFLVPLYIAGLFIAHTNGVYPKYYPPCKLNDTTPHNCAPRHNSVIYQQEVRSFFSKVGIVVVVLILYFLSSTFTVRSASLIFKTRYCRFMEVYIWYCTLIGIHICMGLAGIPILIFLIITPTYTFFFVCSIGLIIILLSIPVMLCLQGCHTISVVYLAGSEPYRYQTWSLKFMRTVLGYVLATSLFVLLLYLYYCLLVGGASMNGTKGVLFALIPPALVTLSAFFIRRKFLKSKNRVARKDGACERIINNTEQNV